MKVYGPLLNVTGTATQVPYYDSTGLLTSAAGMVYTGSRLSVGGTAQATPGTFHMKTAGGATADGLTLEANATTDKWILTPDGAGTHLLGFMYSGNTSFNLTLANNTLSGFGPSAAVYKLGVREADGGTDPALLQFNQVKPVVGVTNSNTTPNNFSALVFGGSSNSTKPFDSGIFAVHESHTPSQEIGHLEFWTRNWDGTTSTFAKGLIVKANRSIQMPNYTTAGILHNDTSGNITSSLIVAADIAPGAIQAGSKNYIAYNNFENNSSLGWSLFNTTLTSLIPTGSITAGAASMTTFATTATNPLAGTYSLALGNASANLTAGQGVISDALTIDREDRSKMLSFKFAYELAAGSGNFSGSSANTWAVYLYDVANSAWVQPAGVYNLVQSSGVGTASGTFQTASNATQYRLALVCINATTGGSHVINLDDFSLGPQALASGPAMSDWTAYTPTFGGITVTTLGYSEWRRIGDTMQIRGTVVNCATVTASTLTISIPTGASIRPFTGTSGGVMNGSFESESATATQAGVFPIWNTATTVGFGKNNSQTGLSAIPASQVLTTGIGFSWTAEFPIAGWSSNSAQSSDTDTRVIAASYASANTTVTVANSDITVIPFTSLIKDTSGSYNTTTGAYAVPVAGQYYVLANAYLASTASWVIRVYQNGIAKSYGNIVSGGQSQTFALLDCKAGDIIDIRASLNAGSASVTAGLSSSSRDQLSITRISGPAVVTATESVYAIYKLSASTANLSFGSNTWKIADFDSKVKDTHSAVTTGASWAFKAPVSGAFRVTCHTNWASTVNLTDEEMAIYVNGSLYSWIARSTNSPGMSGAGSVYLNAGDTLNINLSQTDSGSASRNIDTASGRNLLCIERVGN